MPLDARLVDVAPSGARRPVAGEVTGAVHSWDLSTGVDGPGTRFVLLHPYRQ